MTAPAGEGRVMRRRAEPLLFEIPSENEDGYPLPEAPPAEALYPAALLRGRVGIPSVTRTRVIRHFTRLSQRNFGIDSGSYPLGSCSMKLNPKIFEDVASWPEVSDVHPLLPDEAVQGTLEAMFGLQEVLKAVSGMDAVSLQPAAGAQGEFVGMLVTRAYHRDRGHDRTEVIVPDSAHGTNPSSAALAGFDVVEIPSNGEGRVDLAALEGALSDRTAAFMLTNPNTLGIFEADVEKIARMVHDAGALLYYDGANLNAIMGVTNPGRMGFDVVHFNLHKTFATPHGGGGPGAGPVGVRQRLADYLPVPVVVKEGDRYRRRYDLPKTIGKVRGFFGNSGVLVRAWTYALLHGSDGLADISRAAVLNANYLKKRVEDIFEMPFGGLRKHEFVASASKLKRERGIRAMDIAKRMLDYGVYAPTVYFPLIVDEALMIEPTETESKAELDDLADILHAIVAEDPEVVRGAPHATPVGRVDEVRAARKPVLKYEDGGRDSMT